MTWGDSLMLKLFDGIIGKKTNVNTTFFCQAIIIEDVKRILYICKPKFNPCESVESIQFVYEWINLELNLLNDKMYENFTFNVKLNGRLNGSVVNEEFLTIDEYRLYLETTGILQPNIRRLVPT